MRFYVASSWRNITQASIVRDLRDMGHHVYDFKNPPARTAFNWRDVNPNYQLWSNEEYVQHLADDPLVKAGFSSDFNAMLSADACVMVMPCGRSAHIEAGYFVGAGKKLCILLDGEERACDGNPELMYLMADKVCPNRQQMLDWARNLTKEDCCDV